jgi:hypothetical protein
LEGLERTLQSIDELANYTRELGSQTLVAINQRAFELAGFCAGSPTSIAQTRSNDPGIGGTGHKSGDGNGIGRTGEPAARSPGIGGTGEPAARSPGIGGTGIIGTISDVASRIRTDCCRSHNDARVRRYSGRAKLHKAFAPPTRCAAQSMPIFRRLPVGTEGISMFRKWIRIGIPATAIALVPFALHAAPERGVCKQVTFACLHAGFVQGGATEGNGLWRDCIGPIMQGTIQRHVSLPLPMVNPRVVAACRTSNPAFGQPRWVHGDYGGPSFARPAAPVRPPRLPKHLRGRPPPSRPSRRQAQKPRRPSQGRSRRRGRRPCG